MIPARLLLAYLVIAAAASGAYAGDEEACRTIPGHLRLLSQPMSAAQVEAQTLAEIAGEPERVPQVPFGFVNAAWRTFKEQVREGDTLIKYVGGGLGGYLLVRSGCLIGSFNTTVID